MVSTVCRLFFKKRKSHFHVLGKLFCVPRTWILHASLSQFWFCSTHFDIEEVVTRLLLSDMLQSSVKCCKGHFANCFLTAFTQAVVIYLSGFGC